MQSCLHILQYACIHEHPHNKDSIIIYKYILLFCTLFAIVARQYAHLTARSSHNHILFDMKQQTPRSPVSCPTRVAIIPYYINEIRRKKDYVVYKIPTPKHLGSIMFDQVSVKKDVSVKCLFPGPIHVYICLCVPIFVLLMHMYIQCSFELTISYMCQYLLIYVFYIQNLPCIPRLHTPTCTYVGLVSTYITYTCIKRKSKPNTIPNN